MRLYSCNPLIILARRGLGLRPGGDGRPRAIVQRPVAQILFVVKRDAALECRQRCVSDSRWKNGYHSAERLYHAETALKSDTADGVEDRVYERARRSAGFTELLTTRISWQVSRRMLEKDLADWLGVSAGKLQRLSRLQSALSSSHLHRAIRRGTRMTLREWRLQPLSRLGALYQERIPGHHIVL